MTATPARPRAARLTVADLRARLADLPGDLPVILVLDGEGNDFSPLIGAGSALYLAESASGGECYPAEESRLAHGHAPAPAGAKPAYFLWPA